MPLIAHTRALSGHFSQRLRIINALLIRELMARYGHRNIGFLWQVAEPMALALGVMISWRFIYGPENHGVRIIPLVLTGYSVLTLWRHMIGRFNHVFRHGSGLLFHQSVRPADIIIARGLLESIGILIAFFAAYIPLWLLDVVDPVQDYLLLLSGWSLLSFFIFGFAIGIAALSHLSETFERFVQPILYITLPLTGAFYMVYWLPPLAREIVLYSPLVHATEMIRAGYFGEEVPTFWNPYFLAAWGIAVNTSGWLLMLKAGRHVELE